MDIVFAHLLKNLNKVSFAWLLFEQKDDAEEIRSEEETLYFLIPYHKRECIKHFGRLLYENGLFNYHCNVYLLKGSTSKDEIKRICTLKRDANPNISNIDRFALYTIDPNKISSDAKLYLDPNNSYGIYNTQLLYKPLYQCWSRIVQRQIQSIQESVQRNNRHTFLPFQAIKTMRLKIFHTRVVF